MSESTKAALVGLFIGVLGMVIEWYAIRAHMRVMFGKMKLILADRAEISLNEEFMLAQRLADIIHNSGFNPDLIVAIAPGGIMLAEWLSRRFLGDYHHPVPVRTLWIETSQTIGGMTSVRAKIQTDPQTIIQGTSPTAKVLLVNDISRGGATLNAAYDFLIKNYPQGKIKAATLFYHVDTTAKPSYFVIATQKTIRFEWKG